VVRVTFSSAISHSYRRGPFKRYHRLLNDNRKKKKKNGCPAEPISGDSPRTRPASALSDYKSLIIIINHQRVWRHDLRSLIGKPCAPEGFSQYLLRALAGRFRRRKPLNHAGLYFDLYIAIIANRCPNTTHAREYIK